MAVFIGVAGVHSHVDSYPRSPLSLVKWPSAAIWISLIFQHRKMAGSMFNLDIMLFIYNISQCVYTYVYIYAYIHSPWSLYIYNYIIYNIYLYPYMSHEIIICWWWPGGWTAATWSSGAARRWTTDRRDNRWCNASETLGAGELILDLLKMFIENPGSTLW